MKYVYGKQSLHICLRSSVILNICQRSLSHCCLRQYWLMHRWILSGHYGRYAPSHTIKVIIIPCRSYKKRSYQHHILWTTSCQTVIYWPPTCVVEQVEQTDGYDGWCWFSITRWWLLSILIRFWYTNLFSFTYIRSWKSSFQLGIHHICITALEQSR